MSTEEKKQEERLPVEVRAQMLQKVTSIYFNLAKFEHAQRIATLFASSTMVPQHFQGNVANCLIALNYADRLQADPFMVLQNMYVVHGRPGVEAKLVIALINQSGKYAEPLKYKFDGEKDDYGCTAWTREAKSGEVVEGPKVNWRMVKAEGWDKKSGTKWATIPDLMFRYRAASWFANVHCPELKLGMQTVEEINDFVEMKQTGKGKYQAAPVEVVDNGPALPFDEVFADEIRDPQWRLYLTTCCDTYKLSENDMRAEFVQQPEQIKRLFVSWKTKIVQEPSVNVTPTFRDEWINLKGPGFSTAVFRNLERFKKLEGEAFSEAVNKWQKLYPGDKCPFVPVVEPKNEQEATQEPQGDEIASAMPTDSGDPMREELECLRAEIAVHERTHSGYVLQAKRETGIAHATTVDGCRVLLKKVDALLKDRPAGGK